eukprot:553345-Rhodomonas_salina.4
MSGDCGTEVVGCKPHQHERRGAWRDLAEEFDEEGQVGDEADRLRMQNSKTGTTGQPRSHGAKHRLGHAEDDMIG